MVQERVVEAVATLRHRDFRNLWFGQLASETGDAAGRIGLALLVLRDTGSPFLTAAVAAVFVAPYLGIGQAVTLRCERFERRRVLIVTDLLRAGAFLAIGLPLPIWARFALLFVAGCATPPFDAVRSALTPVTLPPNELHHGVSLVVVTADATSLLGLAIGGALASLISPNLVVALNGGSFLISAFFVWRMTLTTTDQDRSEIRVTLRESWRSLVDDQAVNAVQRAFPIAAVGPMTADALVAAYAATIVVNAGWVAGLLAAVAAATVLLTTVALPSTTSAPVLVRQIGICCLAGGLVAGAGFASGARLPSALLAYVGVGIVLASRVQASTVLAGRLEDRSRASAFSILNGLVAAGAVGAALGGGYLADQIGPAAASGWFSLLPVCVGLWVLVTQPAGRVSATG